MCEPKEGIRLRALELHDVDTLYEWENRRELWDAGNTLAPYSRKQLLDYVANYDGDIYSARQLRLMIAVEGKIDPVGTVDLFDFDPSNSRCAIGIFVAPEHQGKGYGAKAVEMVCEYCRSVLSLHQLYAITAADNTASRALFESAGFAVSGRLRSWLRRSDRYTDAFIYQKLLVRL